MHAGSNRSCVFGWDYPGKIEKAEAAFKDQGNRSLQKQNLEGNRAAAGTWVAPERDSRQCQMLQRAVTSGEESDS